MSHEPHWSGAHCHECFIEQAASEPHPMDDTPLGLMLDELTRTFYNDAIFGEAFPAQSRRSKSGQMRDMLPEHYKETNATKTS